MLLLLCGRDHVGCRIRCPSIDEVTVRAPRRSTRQLAGEVTVPATRQHFAQVIADGEAELRHALHALRAPVGGPVGTVLVACLESLLVDTVGEKEKRLKVGGARLGGKSRSVKRRGSVAFTTPGDLCVCWHARLSCCFRIASNHFQVLRNGDLGRCFTKVVICAEAHHGNGFVGLAIFGVQWRGNPVDRQVIGILRVGAASLQLGRCVSGSCYGIRAKKGVQMGLAVRAWEHNRVDILVHERCRNVDLGVRGGELGEQACAQDESARRRHPVSVV